MNCNLWQTRRTKTKELNSIRLDVDVVFENCNFLFSMKMFDVVTTVLQYYGLI